MKLDSKKSGAVGLILLVLVSIAFIALFNRSSGESILYFNAESDLPDPLVYMKQSYRNNTLPIHVLEIGEKYNVVFSVESQENEEKNYQLKIDSDLVNKTESFKLKPKESKKFSISIEPSVDSKWVLNSTEVSKNENTLDITKNSWLAERSQFTVVVREKGLPAIVEERYDLPISSNIDSFGRVYHMNVSLEELQMNPFERSNINVNAREFEKKLVNDSIRLSVEGSRLHVVSKSDSKQYISEPTLFRVSLIEAEGMADISVDETTGLIDVQDISFLYRIR